MDNCFRTQKLSLCKWIIHIALFDFMVVDNGQEMRFGVHCARQV